MINSTSRKIINSLQGGFPISSAPFLKISKQLNINEDYLIKQIKLLLDSKILTRFGPMFDAQKIGGNFTLAALSVPKNRFDKVSDIVNSFNQVAHNYQRAHKLNMWFVVASDKEEDIQNTLVSIEKKTNLKIYNFPKIYEFYIGLYLELDDENQVKTKSIVRHFCVNTYAIDKTDKAIIKQTQSGLSLVANPYKIVAKNLNIDEGFVIKRMQKMLNHGIIRRIGVVPNHYKLGLTGNAMSVWNVTNDKTQKLGKKIAKLDFVSHAYERPRHMPDWQYNLFVMVHGMNKEEVLEKTTIIKKILGKDCLGFDLIFSTKILKKTGLRLNV